MGKNSTLKLINVNVLGIKYGVNLMREMDIANVQVINNFLVAGMKSLISISVVAMINVTGPNNTILNLKLANAPEI